MCLPATQGRARRQIVIYPFVFAVFPTLSLAAGNPGENIGLSDLGLPLGICLWVALVAWLTSRLFSPDQHRRALLASTIVVWFTWYGMFGLLAAVLGLGPLASDTYVFPSSLVLLLLVGWTILKWKGSTAHATPFLNRMSVILLLLLPIRYLGASPAPTVSWEPVLPPATPSRLRSDSLPDIYYIVLDAYSGGTSLRKHYGFDNGEFERRLESLGFYVPHRSRSNYSSTFLALAAALNWEYLDWIPRLIGSDSKDRTLPYRMIEDSRTAKFLKRTGYRVVFFPTAYGATAQNRLADEVIPDGAVHQPRVESEFQAVWVTSTALRPLLQLRCLVSGCESSPFPFRPEPPELIRWKLTRLAELPTSSPGPKFVFAHLLVPHEPYVFRRDCSPKPLYWPSQVGPEEDRSMRLAYVEQVQCVNQQVLVLVQRLQKDSSRPPIIILQADHGNGRFPFGRPPALEDISDEQLEDRTTVFGAYYLPGIPSPFSEFVTPINVMPAVLRAYFGAQIPSLRDRTYYSSWERPYHFTEVPTQRSADSSH